MFVQNFVGRQDQLKQQQIEEEQRRQQAAQLELQNQRQREQLDLQLRQQKQNEDAQQYNRERTDRLDALGQRETELKDIISPQVNAFMDGVTADMRRYAPTLDGGRPNPQYNQALFMAAKGRFDQAKKLWSNLSLAVGAGTNYDSAKQALVGFIGGEAVAPAAPGQPITMPAQAAQPAAPSTGMPALAEPTQQPASVMPPGPAAVTLPSTGEPGASFTFTPEQPTQAPTLALPQDVREIPLDQLLTLDDQALLSQYGEPGLQYVNAARAQYRAEVKARTDAAQAANVKLWDTQFEQLAKDPNLTPKQREAMYVITQLNQKPMAEVTDADRELFSRAINDLAPAIYTAASWNKLLEDGDPEAILSALPLYQQRAPDIVSGFNPAPWQAKQDLTRRETEARIRDVASQTTERDKLLPGKMAAQAADLANKGADTAGKVATTDQTVQATDKARYDLAVTKLTQIAGTNATVYQIQQTNPQLWFQLKQGLGVNDAGLTALLQQARYEYNQGIRGKELDNRLKAAQVNLVGAQTGKAIADTAETTALLPGKVAQQGAQTGLIVAQTDKAQADATRTATLTPLEAGKIAAVTALSWANVGRIQQDLKLDREKTAAYIKGVEGKYAVDMAQIMSLGASTALKRAQNPNDPLYNPLVVSSKPGDPMDLLKKKADIYYVPMQRALDVAAAQQRTIDSLVKQYTGASGSVDQKRLQADPQYLAAVKARDAAIKGAQDYRQKGDNVVTGSMNSLGDKVVPAPTLGKTGTPFKTLGALPGVTLGAVSTALVSRVDNMLGGFTAPGGLIPVINQGTRTKEQQDALYAIGRTVKGANPSAKLPMGQTVTNLKGGESNHNHGTAIDISWKDPKTGKVLAGNDPRAQTAWKALGAIAPQFGLRWGGTFKTADGKPFVDMYHFEVYGDFKLPPTAAAPGAQPTAAPPKPAATPAAKPPSTPTASTPLPGVKRPRLSTADLAVASRTEQGLLRAVKSGDGNAQYAMYTQLVQFGYDSGAVLAFIKANQGAK